MTTGWGAPRHAYEFTAVIADGDSTAADAIWDSLGERGQRDLVLVLGAQARLTAAYLPGAADRIRSQQVMDLRVLLYEGLVHSSVTGYAVAALSGARCTPPPRMDCADLSCCLRKAADAIAEIRLRTAAGLGFPRRQMAVVCRRQAHSLLSPGTTEDPQPCSVLIRPSSRSCPRALRTSVTETSYSLAR